MIDKKSAALFLIVASLGCSTRLPSAGVKAFHTCNYREAIDIFKEKSAKGDKNMVLYDLALISSAMRGRDYDTAEKASFRALGTMWSDAGKGKGQASLISAESIKIFKGDPFEKAMAAIYAGIIYYNRGEYDNARASFTKATLAIKQKKVSHRNDFALAYALLAKTYLKLGDKDNARIALKQARKRYGHPAFNMERLEKENALFFIEIGFAPRKIRTGPGKSLASYVRSKYPERYVSISVDGRSVGRAAEAADLTYQAQTKGRTGKDAVQVTKGVARDAATVATVVAANEAVKGNKTAGWVALGTGLFALANQSQADIRQWELLPDRLHLLSMNLKPGRRAINLRFYNTNQSPLSGYDQVWYYDVEQKADQIYLFWSRRCPARLTTEAL